jgi:hypothetical protein
MDVYGELLEEQRYVDTLKMGTTVDQVGYGAQEMVHVLGTGPPDWNWVEFGPFTMLQLRW